MKHSTGTLFLLLVGLWAAAAWADGPGPAASTTAQAVAPGVWLVPGGVRPDRQPDGNTVVFGAPAGLVVVDTGRHGWHREAILALAGAQKQPVVAIVNTHWHLDHVSGNPDLRAAFPGLRVYASDAIDGALDGFLAQSAKDSVGYLEDSRIPAAMREDIRADLDTIRNGAALKPDVVVDRSGAVELGGRTFTVHLVRDAVTAADLWLYDESRRLAVLGDLVTLPVPYLDTACPEGWSRALDELAATPFELAIPGHGTPMTRGQFDRYRRAFNAFIECADSAAPAAGCAKLWADSVESLLADDDTGKTAARQLAGYYVDLLRANGGRSPHCEAPIGQRRPSRPSPARPGG
jgi:glyoxylase-like metal-dependent hydrolase (beta-lactamase superfamily II)